MRKNNKNGFTIVEIVIVIAVIAILAAVLIPTFANIIKKANQSVDEQLVNNLNKILTTEEAINGKNLFMHEAVLDLKEYGYELDALKMSDSENILLWEQRIDRFIIAKIGQNNPELVYCSKADEEFYENNFKRWHLCWKIYTKDDYVKGKDGYPNGRLPNDEEAKFSIYWGESEEPILDSNGTFMVGLDLGYYEGTLDFTGKGTAANNGWLVFNGSNTRVRGNFNAIQINAFGMYHSGEVGVLHLYLNATSYSNKDDLNHHEYGYVGEVKLVNNASIISGRKLIAESGSKFGQSKTNVENTVGAAHFEDRGATFGTN